MLNATVLHGVLSPTQQMVWNVVRGASNATIDGFTIRDGLANQYDVADVFKFCGAGMFNTGVTNLNVVNCIFQDNMAFAMVTQDPGSCGGGMYNLNSAVTIERCVFKNNSAYRDGGGLCIHGQYDPLTKCMVRKCDFMRNFAGNRAAGVCTRNTDVEFARCVFIDNAGPGHGGGFFNWAEGMDSRPALTHCTFTDNSAQYSYGAIGSAAATGYNGKVIVTKCILWNDWVSQVPNRVTNETYPDAAEVSYSDVKVQPGQFPNDLFPGTGNTNADPLFLVAQPLAPVDLRLSYTPQKSPCIDNTVMPVDPAYPGNRPDMGAYEHAFLMPLGNSITEGYWGDSRYEEGYRRTLWNLMPVDFVGPYQNPSPAKEPNPAFDVDHNGAAAATIERISSNFLTYVNQHEVPDVVLLLAGANNIRDGQDPLFTGSIANPLDVSAYVGAALLALDHLIDAIKAKAAEPGVNKSIIIVVGSIPDFISGAFVNPTTALPGAFSRKYNYETEVTIAVGFPENVTTSGIAGMAVIDNSQVFFVDHAAKLIQSDMADGVHPNRTGYCKVGFSWYERISEILPWAK
jgi:lysophospholipase L1-like esterase